MSREPPTPPPPWRRIVPAPGRPLPRGLDPSDTCYAASEYRPRLRGAPPGGRRALLLDFKIPLPGPAGCATPPGSLPPASAGRLLWRKEEACRAFASDLALALPPGALVCPIPSSRPPDSPGHDPRMRLLLDCLGAIRPDLRLAESLVVTRACLPAHQGGPRSPGSLRRRLAWRGPGRPAGALSLVDDVITTGSHFQACRDLLRGLGAGPVTGYFWARAVDTA